MRLVSVINVITAATRGYSVSRKPPRAAAAIQAKKEPAG
jgi:hypothetical protein